MGRSVRVAVGRVPEGFFRRPVWQWFEFGGVFVRRRVGDHGDSPHDGLRQVDVCSRVRGCEVEEVSDGPSPLCGVLNGRHEGRPPRAGGDLCGSFVPERVGQELGPIRRERGAGFGGLDHDSGG